MSAKSLNKVLLIGNLTRDPEIKVTPSGASVCTFGIATNSRYKKPDGNYEELTNFHNIVAWSKLAEICAAKLKKGMKVYVEGELRTRIWDDNDTKKKMHRAEVRITEMIIMSERGNKDMANADDNESFTSDDIAAEELTEDDLPI